MTLSDVSFSLDHALLLDTLAANDQLLIIQDLDGVCMGLVRDPLTRSIDRRYVEATQKLAGHFHVLTNGEHIGRRGVNMIVEKAFDTPQRVRERGYYLPGLAGGGVQLQDRNGTVSHPGVTQAELAFLSAVPEKAAQFLARILVASPYRLQAMEIDALIESSVLDNLVSPTINLNHFHLRFRDQLERYRQLQRDIEQFMTTLLEEAADQQLQDAFFVHYAPNLGRDASGEEHLKFGDGRSAGTHDFQFMLKGAIKEVGVLVLLNHYYHQHWGEYPLGEHFNAREAPRKLGALLKLARGHFDPRHMPRIVGVGDTVTAYAQEVNGQTRRLRGGSDRGFLTLIQEIGKAFDTDNAVIYVDSSGGEVQRPGLDAVLLCQRTGSPAIKPWAAVKDISDAQDPLTLNFVFPGGHEQYVDFFRALAEKFPDATQQTADRDRLPRGLSIGRGPGDHS